MDDFVNVLLAIFLLLLMLLFLTLVVRPAYSMLLH